MTEESKRNGISAIIAVALSSAMSLYQWDGIVQYMTDVLVLFVLITGIQILLSMGKKYFGKEKVNGSDRTE